MTTPAQTGGKGKKKTKEVLKVSLDEFNQIDAPLGHSVVNVKVSGLDWAATMANYDDKANETKQIIVPSAPRAHRGPGIEFEALPDEPPFRVSVFNVPLSAEDQELAERFFIGLDVVNVESNKQSTTVEFATKDNLYEALCKDGSSFKGKPVNVCLFGHQPQPQGGYGSGYGGYGGRSGGGGFGDRYGSDRYGERGGGGYGDRGGYGAPRGDRYESRGVGFGGGQREGGAGAYGGFARQGGAQQGAYQPRTGFNDRYNDRGNFRDDAYGGEQEREEEPDNWRDRPAAPPAPSPYQQSRQPYGGRQDSYYNQPPSNYPASRSDSQYQSRYPAQPPSNYPPSAYSQHNNNLNDSAPAEHAAPSERPKLKLNPRKVTSTNNDEPVRNPAIFGAAKPSSKPYEKMAEVEEKLKAVSLTSKPADVPAAPSSIAGSQTGSQSGSAPRSRKVSSNHDEAKVEN